MFYILVVLLSVARIFNNVWIVLEKHVSFNMMFELTPAVFINLGLAQCWSYCELALRIDLNVKHTRLQMGQLTQTFAQAKKE